MPYKYEICGAKQTANGWKTCNRKAGHKGEHSDTKMSPATYWKQTTEEKSNAEHR